MDQPTNDHEAMVAVLGRAGTAPWRLVRGAELTSTTTPAPAIHAPERARACRNQTVTLLRNEPN